MNSDLDLTRYNLPADSIKQIEEAFKEYAGAAIKNMSAHYMPLLVKGIDDKEGYAAVHEARIVVKRTRVAVKKAHDSLKRKALNFGRACDATANWIYEKIGPIEEHLKEQEKIVEDEKRRIQEEKNRKAQEKAQKRIDDLHALNATFDINEVIMLSDEDYQARFDKATADYEAEQKRRMEEERKREAERMQLEKQRQEQERIAREQAEKEAAMRAEQEKIEAERRRIEEEKAEKRRQEELEKARKEAAEKAKREAEEEAKRKEQERIEAECRAKEEAERQERLKPDKDKLLAFAEMLENLNTPELKSNKAKTLLSEVVLDIKNISNSIRLGIKKL